MKIQPTIAAAFFAAVLIAAATASPGPTDTISGSGRTGGFSFSVEPETLSIAITSGGETVAACDPWERQTISDLETSAGRIAWHFPERKLAVEVMKAGDHLRVTFGSRDVSSLAWPSVRGSAHFIPFGEGKYVASGDAAWGKFLSEEESDLNEFLSMPFMATEKKTFTLMYLFSGRYNTAISFSGAPISWETRHEFTAIDGKKTWSVDIVPVASDPVSVAKRYRKSLIDSGDFVSLADKAKANPDVGKLFGAAHFYLWDAEIIDEGDIVWPRLKAMAKRGEAAWLTAYWSDYAPRFADAMAAWNDFAGTEYNDNYQKRIISDALSEMMKDPNLSGSAEKTEAETCEANKAFMAKRLTGAVVPASDWGNGVSLPLLADMKKAGIERAWIGLNEWMPGIRNRTFVKEATASGYLVGPYDSYNSVHSVRDESWQTAWFPDPGVYENDTVTDKTGKKTPGFLGRGRKPNPVFILDDVRKRVDSILANGVAFNSWFIDCDAAGELREDYTPGHLTTQAQAWEGRRRRIAFIRDEKRMVIGSELGIDYAAKDIAFAHGLETPVIAWGDEDMRKNEKSPYFIGKYWSARGGVPDRFGKQVPLKAEYRRIYLDETSTIPLYKLVYNDSVITSHHWENGSLKYSGEVENRMLHEILYNVPPLYHLDRNAWKAYGARITRHCTEFAAFHRRAVTTEMTGFRVLSPDRKLQMATYGTDHTVIANFGASPSVTALGVCPPKSAIIEQDGVRHTYTPNGN